MVNEVESEKTFKALLVACIVLLFSAVPVFADETETADDGPPSPHVFTGDVIINGEDAPEGAVLVAELNDQEAGSTEITQEGYYELTVAGGMDEDGDVTFYAEEYDGSLVRDDDQKTHEFEAFAEPTSLDLEFSDVQLEEEEDEDDDDDEEEDDPVEIPPDEPEEEPEDVVEDVAEYDEETGESRAEVNATEGQQVTVNMSEEAIDDEATSNIESISATAASDTTVSVSASRATAGQAQDIAEIRDNQLDFSIITIEGEVEDATIQFTVRKDRLEEKEAGPGDVVKERYDDEWVELETRILEELDERYRFEAKTEAMSLYAVAIREEEPEPPEPEADIRLTATDISETEVEEGQEVEIEVELKNFGDVEGTKTVTLEADGEVIDSKQITLQADERDSITFTYEVEEGEQELSIQGESIGTVTGVLAPEDVEPEPERDLTALFIAIAAVVLVILGFVLISKHKEGPGYIEPTSAYKEEKPKKKKKGKKKEHHKSHKSEKGEKEEKHHGKKEHHKSEKKHGEKKRGHKRESDKKLVEETAQKLADEEEKHYEGKESKEAKKEAAEIRAEAEEELREETHHEKKNKKDKEN